MQHRQWRRGYAYVSNRDDAEPGRFASRAADLTSIRQGHGKNAAGLHRIARRYPLIGPQAIREAAPWTTTALPDRRRSSGRSTLRMPCPPNSARPMRWSTSAPTRSDSSSTTGSPGRRCRASTKSPSADSPTGSTPRAGSRKTACGVRWKHLRRFRAIADAMGVERVDVLATEATRRASNGHELIEAIKRETRFEVRILTGTEEATFAGFGVISGFFRPVGLVGDMGGGSLEIAAVDDDRVGAECYSLPLGALPVQSIIAGRGDAAPDAVDRILADGLPKRLSTRDLLCGRRRLARPRQGASRHGRGADRRRPRLPGRRRLVPQVRQVDLEDADGRDRHPAGRPGPPVRHARLGGPGHRPGAEAALARPARLLRPRRPRGLALFAAARGGALSRPAGRGRAVLGPRFGAGSRLRRRARPLDRRPLSGRIARGAPPAGRRLRHFRPRLARPRRSARHGELPADRAVPLHRPRSPRAGLPGGDHPRPLRRPRQGPGDPPCA